MVLAVNVAAVATPLAFVVAVIVVPPPVNVPLAPLVGAVKVTTTLDNRLVAIFHRCLQWRECGADGHTLLCSRSAVIEAGVPARFVRVKLRSVMPLTRLLPVRPAN